MEECPVESDGQGDVVEGNEKNSTEEANTNNEAQDDKNRDYPSNVVSDKLDADIFLLSGPIYRPTSELFLQVARGATGRENAALILTTPGGDADAAYKIARYLKRFYGGFYLYVFGACKSAGTILALGADKIVMSPERGELGPLDVQILREDELVQRSSGLDIFKALEAVHEEAFKMFESQLLEIKRRSGGSITTKTAADIATSIATGLLSPITEQIDPMRLGEVKRSISIALEYGLRLNADREVLQQLIRGYPSHSFVIDIEEAHDLFGDDVCLPDPDDLKMEATVTHMLREQEGDDFLHKPHPDGIAMRCAPVEPRNANNNSEQQSHGSGSQESESSSEADRNGENARVESTEEEGGKDQEEGEHVQGKLGEERDE